MRRLVPIPKHLAEPLKQDVETGIGYQVISVELKNGRSFDQVLASEGCIIEVRKYKEIPFGSDDIASVKVTHKRWNFRGWSDALSKNRDDIP